MKFPIGSMTVGDVLDRGLKLLFARLPLYYGISLMAMSPLILIQFAQPFFLNRLSQGGEPTPAFAIAGLAVVLIVIALTVVLSQVAAAAIVKVVMNEYVDAPVSFSSA